MFKWDFFFKVPSIELKNEGLSIGGKSTMFATIGSDEALSRNCASTR